MFIVPITINFLTTKFISDKIICSYHFCYSFIISNFRALINMRTLLKKYICQGWLKIFYLAWAMLLFVNPHTIQAQTNFIIILTDDQRWDSLWAMPILQQKLIANGVNFTNAFVSTPWCCPARASFLSGGFYPHNTGLVFNWLLYSGYNDSDTIATRLYAEGYKTGYIGGKYMNGYYQLAPYVPPGWTRFVATSEDEHAMDDFNFNITVGQSNSSSSWGTIQQVSQYSTDFMRDEALAFLDGIGNDPFLLYMSTHAPKHHAPAPQDEGLFPDYEYNGRGYSEQDLSDKPSWIQEWFSENGDCRNSPIWDFYYVYSIRDQLRSLQAIDRMVGAIVDRIEQLGKLNETVFVFTSDNGNMWGEHGLCSKGKPYEEAIRVPFIMVVPGNTPKDVEELVVANLDLGTTIYELAGLSITTDGKSLVPLIDGSFTSWRTAFPIQSYIPPIFAGLRVKDTSGEWKYIQHPTEEKELYNLVSDPYEEQSLHADPAYTSIIEGFESQLQNSLGLSILLNADQYLPQGLVGQNYYFQIPVWGGMEPFSWSVCCGNLPNGLLLDAANGVISGVPVEVGTEQFQIYVTASSFATHAGVPEKRFMPLLLKVCNLPARIMGTTPEYFSILQAAYDGAAEGETIQSVQQVTTSFTENLNMNRPVSVALEGGYSCDYSRIGIGWKTRIDGNLTISDGIVTIGSGTIEII